MHSDLIIATGGRCSVVNSPKNVSATHYVGDGLVLRSDRDSGHCFVFAFVFFATVVLVNCIDISTVYLD
jgi:hypothetical protein